MLQMTVTEISLWTRLVGGKKDIKLKKLLVELSFKGFFVPRDDAVSFNQQK